MDSEEPPNVRVACSGDIDEVRRKMTRRKHFPCGHIGKGKFCHYCKQIEYSNQQSAIQKSQWEARIASAGINFDGLPKKFAEKAIDIISKIRTGSSYMEFLGKRLLTMGQREVISIPIGKRYRLIMVEKNGTYEPLELLSHEDYNNRLASGGWIK